MQTNVYPSNRLNINLHAASQYRVQILLAKVDVYRTLTELSLKFPRFCAWLNNT